MNSPSSLAVLRVSHILTFSFLLLILPLAHVWLYGNVLTYPCMAPPVRTEKQLEMRAVNGVEREFKVEAELPLKRLFLFSGKEVC